MVRRRGHSGIAPGATRGGGHSAVAWVLLLVAGLVGVVHAAPTITASSGANTYVERTGLGEFFVDTELAVSSTTTLAFCQIHIIEPADVTLTDGDQLDVVVSNGLTLSTWNAATRSFTVSTPAGSTVSVASYQLVLRRLTFYNPASNPATNTRTIKYTLVDVDGNTAEATKNIAIQLADDTPTVTLTAATRATYAEKAGNVTLDNTVVVEDPDSDSLTSASIQITSGYDEGKDFLYLNQDVTVLRAPDEVTPYGLLGSWDASSGTLNVTGSAPVSVYQDIFRKVLFINDEIAPSTASRVFTYLVRDLSTTSAAVTLTMPVTDVNQIPVLTLTSAATLAYAEGTPLVLDSGLTLTDEDDTTLSSVTITIDEGYNANDTLTATTTGSVSFSYSGGVGSFSGSGTLSDFQASLRTLTYDSVGENPSGTRRVRYDVSDGRDSIAPQYRSITVSSVNDAPIVTANTTSFELQGRETMIMTDTTITDVDSTLMSGATMTITAGCAASSDAITAIVAVPVGLTGSFSSCVYTVSGAANVTTYQNFLRSLRLVVSAESTDITKTLSLVVTDSGGAASTALTRTMFATDNLPRPTITSVTKAPTSGGTVTIVGTNFGPSSPAVVEKVTIGTQTCTSIVLVTEGTTITCTAPSGAGANLNIEVVVSGQKSEVSNLFSYEAPTVTTASSVSTEGANTTIVGTNFGAVGSSNLVSQAQGNITVGGVLCTNPVVTVEHTTIVCLMPAGTGGSKDVIVTLAGQTSGTTGASDFSYSSPVVTTATKGSFLGYYFYLYGSNFGAAGTSASVSLIQNGASSGSFSCTTVTVVNHTTIYAYVPAATSATLTTLYDVTVTVDSLSGTGSSTFQYEGPVIESIATLSYYGAVATITGRNFGNVSGTSAVTAVTLGTYSITAATTTAISSAVCTPNVTTEHTTICVYFPDYVTTGSAMSPSITVTFSATPGSQTSAAYTSFSYEGPVITNQAYGNMFGGGLTNGASVTITGRNFGRTLSGVTYDTPVITIGGTTVTGTNTVTSPTTIVITKTPADDSGPYTDQNQTISGTLNGQTFTGGTSKFSYLGPEVTSVDAFDSRGATIVINGQRFGPTGTTYYDTGTYANAAITVCTNAACTSTTSCTGGSVTSVNTKLTCVLGEGAYVNNKITVAPYTAALDSGSTGATAVTVSTPTVTAASSPPAVGGTTTITGTNFGPTGSTYVSVLIDGVSCSGATVTLTPTTGDSTLTCTAAKGTGRQKNVNVTLSNNGAISSGTNSLFAYAVPTVTSVTLPSTSGGTVTIVGTNFGPVGTATLTSVTLNGGALTSASVTVDDTTIVGTYLTAGTGGGYNALVTIDSQSSATNTLFSYANPAVESITTAPAILGGSLIIAGQNFGPTGLASSKISVSVSDATSTTIPCSQPVVTANTQLSCVITCTTPCTTEARTVTVVIDSLTNTSASSLLTFVGPIVSSATADVSLHGSQTVTGLAPLLITGENFGRIDGSDGSYLTSVQVCAMTTKAACDTYNGWVTATGPGTGSVPTVTTDNTQITAYIPGGITVNNTVLVTASGANSGTTGEGAFDYIAPQISFDSTNSVVNRAPTAGGTMTIAGIRFGATGTANMIKVLWNFADITSTAGADVITQDTNVQMTVPSGAGSVQLSFDIAFNGTAAGALSSNVVTVKYASPVITAVTTVPSSGGTTTITGTSFGPVGTSYLTLVKVTNSTGLYVNATSWSVTVADTEIQAVIPGGVGSGLNLELTLGGQAATGGAGLFNYAGPAITSVTSLPTGPPYTNITGYDGTSNSWVTITGTNFGPVGTLTSGVLIGNTACNNPNVTVAQTQIQCQLGEGSGTDYDVVFTVGAQALSSSSGVKAFTFDSPTITNITRVNFFGGETITITGTNFGCTPNVGSSPVCVLPRFGLTQNITLTIDGKSCTSPTVTVDHTAMTCTAPAMLDQVNITTLPVVLDVGGLNVTTYTYDYYGPRILAVTEGSLFGGTVTITGENFGPVGTSNIAFMSIGGTQQNLTTVVPTVTVNNTEIQFTSPSASGLNLTLVLVIRGQSTGTTGNAIFSYVGPRISSASSPSTAGGSLTITGRNFGPDGTTFVELLLVNGVPCTGGTVSSSGTTITCTMPSGSGGAKDISLRINGESDENTGKGVFSYQLPTITGISPLNAGPNETITFTGESFGANQDTVSITIGGAPCTNVTLVTPHTQLSCTTPKDNGLDKQVFITVDGLTSTQGVFSYSAPQIESTTPLVAAGGAVNITGKYFGPLGNATLNSVFLGSAECVNPQVIQDEVLITCVAPPMKSTDDGGQFAPADLDGQGLMAVAVTVNGQTGTGADTFSFIQPAVTSISTLSGGFQDRVNVGGSNFGEVGKAVTVLVNGTASPTISGHTGIGFTFAIPPAAGVTNLVQVFIYGREANYTTLTTAERNLVYKAPEIQQLRTIPPATTRGGNVTFVGKYFGPVGSTFIDDVYIHHPTEINTRIPCLNPSVTAADTEITCLVGAGSGKDIRVVITIAGQDSGDTGNLAFRYSRPSVNLVRPSVGLPAGGLIYVNGTNFGPNADSINLIKVFGPGDQQCGGIPCTEVSMAVPHQQVRCVLPISVGVNNWIVVNIGGQESLTSDLALYSYPSPTIFNVTSANTDGVVPGALVTITGRGFGPVSDTGGCYQTYIESVVVGKDFDGADLRCADPRVTVADTQLVCLAAPGAGADNDVTMTLRGSTTLSSGLGAFSYNPPEVYAVSALDTIGGTLIITGVNFGPVTQASVPAPVVEVYSKEVCSLEQNGCLSEQLQLCTNPRVVGGGHTTIECEHPAGTGGGYTVVVTVVGQPSGTSGDGTFSFAVPTTESLFPFEQPQSETSTEITVVGRNFGDNPFKVNVTVGGRIVDSNTIRLFAERDRFNNPTGRSELRALAPPGAGEGLPVIVIVDSLESPVNDAVRFSYSAPFITGSDPVTTQGGLTTIYGGNFGPRDIIPDIVTIDGKPCADPRITVADQQITCIAAPGVGHSLDIYIQINKDQNKNTVDSGAGKFRYECPEIAAAADGGVAMGDLVLPGEGTTGQSLTITGRNFGNVTGTVTVGIEYPLSYRTQLAAEGVEVVEPYWTTSDYVLAPGFAPSPTGTYRVVVTTPVGFGINLRVRINVAGQDNIDMCETTAIRSPAPLYTFNPPRDLVVQTRPPTSGGRIVVQGVNFGPLGTGGVQAVRALNYNGLEVACANPVVTRSNVALECDLGPGAGGNLVMVVTVGGQSTPEVAGAVYTPLSYAVPVVETIDPVLVQTGDAVLVAGTNFGTDVIAIGIRVMDKDNLFYADVAPDGIVLEADHTTLNVTLPLGTGISHWLEVTVPAGGSEFGQVSGDTVSKQYFSYRPPVVTEALPVPTQGGVAVIRGDNFGNDQRVVTNVFVAGQRCQGLIITVPEVEMRCNASRGSGDSLDVTFTVDGQESVGGLNAFQYENPVITTVQPDVAYPGSTVTIFGANFGLNPVDVSVRIGDVPCATVEIVREDTEITCVVQDGRGLDQPVEVTVNNLVNLVLPNFTYSLVGCTDATAANWDPEATVLPAPGAAGSCIYPGCTVAEALNFDARANQNDGSCIRKPVQVSFRFQLDWIEYQSRPEYYNDIVEEDVAAQVGVPKSRVNVTNAVPGSVVFTLDIFDNVTYHAVQIAADLERDVLQSSFVSQLVLLDFFRVVEAGAPPVVIKTKENEPTVSTESIIGLIIGVVVLIVWAIYWRQMLTCVVSMCCGRRKRVGVEVAHYEDPDEEAPLTPAGKVQPRA